MKNGSDQVNQAPAGGKPASEQPHAGEPASGAGTLYNRLPVKTSMLLKGMNDRTRHAKALRRLCAYLEGWDIGAKEIESLGVVSTWCTLKEREGGALDDIVKWSGYTRNWLRMIYQGIRDCEVLGLLETVKVSGGARLCITVKGHRVIDLYDRMLEVVQKEFEEVRDKEIARRYKMATDKARKVAA